MRSLLPSIIFLVLLAAILTGLITLFRSYGLGMTVVALGVVLIAIGLFGFIFFLSIDPGYGWSKVANFNRNYVVISIAVLVCLVGVFVFCVGREINENEAQTKNEEYRCRQMLAGEVESVVQDEWYQLNDSSVVGNLKGYLFQQRGNNDKFKVVVVGVANTLAQKVSEITITSNLIKQPLNVPGKSGVCSDVFECDLHLSQLHLGKQSPEGSVDFDVKAIYQDTGESCDTGNSAVLHLSR